MRLGLCSVVAVSVGNVRGFQTFNKPGVVEVAHAAAVCENPIDEEQLCLCAGRADATDDAAEVFIRLWESYCYEPDRAVKRRLGPAEDACLAAFAEGRGSFGNPRRVSAFRRFVKMLVASGW